MAWHIFKKDLILLWPAVALSALTQFVLSGLIYASDADPSLRFLMMTAQLFVAVVWVTIIFTIALGVQQDAIPGTRLDWLTRPIRRGDLLLAKLLFVLVAGHLPMLLGDLVSAFFRGLPMGDAAGAVLLRDLHLFMGLTLPVLAFAAMTRTIGQFLGAGVGYFICLGVAVITITLIARQGGQEQATNPLAWTGVSWITQIAGRLALDAGAIIGLVLLYSRRRVVAAWGVFAVFALANVLVVFTPWSWLFAVQAAMAAPAAGLTVAFDPAAPRYAPAPGENLDAYAAGPGQVQLRGRQAGDIDQENRARANQRAVTVLVPVRIAGVPAGAMPWVDRADVRLTTATGQVVFEGRGDALKPDRTASGRAYEAIRVPGLVYQANKDRPLTLQVDFSLTLLKAEAPQSAPALDAKVALPGFGRCTTSRYGDGDQIALRCVRAGSAPSCMSATLEDTASGRRNPDALICAPNYAPFEMREIHDGLSRFEVEAPFRDRLGVAAYPVGAGQLGSARIVVTPYAAMAHGARSVTAEGVRLSAWAAG